MKEFTVKLIENILCLVDSDGIKIGQINKDIDFLMEGDTLFENEILIQPVIEYHQKTSEELQEGDEVFVNRLCKRDYDVVATIELIINDSRICLTNVREYVFELDTTPMEDLIVSRREIIGRKTQKFVYNIAIKAPNEDYWYGKIETV
jgi:DNA replication protein DnaD